MTTGPGPHQVLKWSHSVIGERDFVSEWQAIETGRGLALELGTYDGIRADSSTSNLTSRQSSNKEVGFSNVVDVLIGMDDSLDMHAVSVDGHCVANGSFPWSAGLLRGGLYQHELPVTQHAASLPVGDQAEVSPADNTPFLFTGQSHVLSAWRPSRCSLSQPDSEASMHSGMPATSNVDAAAPRPQPVSIGLPSWGRNILALLQRAGVYDEVDATQIVYVTSYFLNHATHVSHASPRPLRFDEDVHDWEAGIRLVWEDLILPGQPLDVVLVRPDPPLFGFRGTVATVIVHQNPVPDRAACLISVLRPFDPEPRFEEAAHSVELELLPNQVLYLAGVDVQCQQQDDHPAGRCTIHSGQHQFPPDGPIQVFHGLGFHVRVPHVPVDASSSRKVRDEADESEEFSFMARRFVRPAEPVRSTGSSVMSSSSSSRDAPDWRQTIVVVRDGPTLPI